MDLNHKKMYNYCYTKERVKIMKKSLLTCGILIISSSIVTASAVTYSDEYLNHLKTCSIHVEKYSAEIPTNDPNTPVLHLKSTESINGWKNGKCITKSLVYSEDMKQNILSTQCAFSEAQINSIIKKIETAQKGNAKDKQALQQELTKYVQDNSICKVENLIK